MVISIAKRYVLQEEIGRGGMGTVYRALDRLSGGTVALKQLNFSAEALAEADDQSRQEFMLSIAHEFRVMASVRHPNIATVYDYGFDTVNDGIYPYMTVELIKNAQDIVTAAVELPRWQQIHLLMQLLDAIGYLHQRNIIHCDLKPSNVLLTWQDDTPIVKMLDFGLAADDQSRPPFASTLAYTAPELLRDDAAVATAKSDLYSFGMIAYAILANRPVFAKTPLMTNRLLEDVEKSDFDLEAIQGSGNLRAVIANLLEPNPENRYGSAWVVQQQLAAATGYSIPSETQQIRESYLQSAKFIGRDAELAALRQQLAQVKAGKGRALIMTGESGIGKSRLIDELAVWALTDGFTVLQGQAVAEGGASYQLWRDTLPPLVLTSELSNFSAGVLRAVVPNIDMLLQRPIPVAEEVTPFVEQLRLIDQIIALFQQQRQPVLLVLRDLHWASESLTVLKALIDVVEQLPLFILGDRKSVV